MSTDDKAPEAAAPPREEYAHVWEERVAALGAELASLRTRVGNVMDSAYEKVLEQWNIAKSKLEHLRTGGSDKGGILPAEPQKAWDSVAAAPGPAQHELPPQKTAEATAADETTAATRPTSPGFAIVNPETRVKYTPSGS